jgi:polyferredoxin
MICDSQDFNETDSSCIQIFLCKYKCNIVIFKLFIYRTRGRRQANNLVPLQTDILYIFLKPELTGTLFPIYFSVLSVLVPLIGCHPTQLPAWLTP